MNAATKKIDLTINAKMQFSERYRFADWPNPRIPILAAGVYAVWDAEKLIYCGMSGRDFKKAQTDQKKKYGLVTRLASHASGRLSGDQFCVYVANRLVIPTIQQEELSRFASGELTLDRLTKMYIHNHFAYQFAVVETSKQAFELEMKARQGAIFGVKPLLNPAS
ncbi:hypothetical protein ACFQUU_03605 [Herbaspirillum sp. GCM10030257]|uniref:hypothetical protein n=1 Tax=Herbaspirillum sp. GCM10030257 TaxID=3273393 RepID=UPI003605C180